MRKGFLVLNVREKNDQSNVHSHMYRNKAGYVVVKPNHDTASFDKTDKFFVAILDGKPLFHPISFLPCFVAKDSDDFDDIRASLKQKKGSEATEDEVLLEARRQVFGEIVTEMEEVCERSFGNYCQIEIEKNEKIENRCWRMEIKFVIVASM